MPNDWPFNDRDDLAVFTLKRIVRGGSPILLVYHNEDDGGWRFLDGEDAAVEEACVVGLRSITETDPRVLELADLPHGWVASRADPGEPWQRAPIATGEDRERRVVSDIGECGWHVVLIPEDGRRPLTGYSVGLFKNFGHPEIVIFGYDPSELRRVIDRIGEEVRKSRRFLDGESVSGIVEHYNIQFYEIPHRFYGEDERFGEARRIYGCGDFRLLQGYWPDYLACCP